MENLNRYIDKKKPASMASIAKGLGVSRPYLYDLMEERRHPSIDVAVTLSTNSDGEIPISSWPNLARVFEAMNVDVPADPVQ